jgi:hypothetical protein
VVAGAVEQADDYVADDCHDAGGGAGTDCGGVFCEGDVADVVVGLDVPVAADDVGEVGGCGLLGGEAGDAEDGGGGDGAVGEVSVVLDQESLVRAGKVDLVVLVGGVGQVDGLEDAPVAAAVSCVLFGVAGLGGGPGQGVEGGEECGLVSLLGIRT